MEDISNSEANTILTRFFPSSLNFDVDTREPSLFFTIPHVGRFGFIGLSSSFWMLSFFLLIIQSVVNVVVAVIVFFCIVRPERNKKDGSKPQVSYLIGYGIIIPLIFWLTWRLVAYLDLRNAALMFTVAAGSPALLPFRCLEAMHGTLPRFATQSLSKFVFYYTSTIQFEFDPKTQAPVPLTTHRFLQRGSKFLQSYVCATLLLSLLRPCNYNLFPQTTPGNNLLWDMLHWRHILNNYLMALLSASMAEANITGLGLVTSLLSGIQTMEFNNSPLTASTSPRDFWSNRWNRIVGTALRRGIFQPLKNSGYSSQLAAFATFGVSGLFHEYLLVILTLRGGSVLSLSSGKPYQPSYGKQFIFFLWNGLGVVADQLVSKHPIIVWMQTNLPRPCRTFLLLMLVLPISHFFTDEFVFSGLYDDVGFAFPRLVYVTE